ncbi:retrovirus-related pol polyprotein from transposon TNT 1-94 [Tanacetum coccineum]
MVADLRYFNSLEHEVDSLKSQLETQKTQFLNEIDRLSREYNYADNMNAILGVYTTLDEFTDLQCDYVDQVVKCERLKKELSKSNTTSKSFEALQKHAINLELALQQCKEQIKKDKAFKENQSNNTNVIAPGMYKVHTKPNQTRTPQFPQDIKKTNKRVSFSTGVIPTTSVSRPRLKSNQLEDRVMPNNSQGKKKEVEDHRRNFKFSNNKTYVTACNDSLNAKTSNVNFVYVTYGKCVLNENHDMCVLHDINGVNSRTKMSMAVPICTREPKRTVNQYIATSLRRTIASKSTNQKPRSTIRKLYEHVTRRYNSIHRRLWVLKEHDGKSQASKAESTNLFFVGQFCDANLEVAFRKSTCYIRDLNGNDLLTGSHGTDLYSITLQDTSTPNPIFLMSKALSSQTWLWHRRLSHLNFDSINLLSKDNIVIGLPKLKCVKDYLCSSWYSTQSRAYRVYNKRKRVIVETIHVNIDELPHMVSDHISSNSAPQCPTTALEQNSLSLGPQSQENVTHTAETVTTSKEMDFLFSLMFDELLIGTTQVVSNSSAATTADTPNQRQQKHTTPSTSKTVAADTPLNIQTTPETTSQAPTVTPIKNINQAETPKENA